jgi:hypothetical protein
VQTGVNDARRLADSGRRKPLWQAARSDPAHLPELVLVRVLPLLSPGVSHWASGLESVKTTPPEQLAREQVHSSTVQARWVGSITGSSFYVGMPSALAVIYCEQLLVVLRIAAIFGHDPQSAARAPELLVIQGRYVTIEEAEKSILLAGTGREGEVNPAASEDSRSLFRQALSMIGLRLRDVRRPIDVLIIIVAVLSFALPGVGIPFWAVANARVTRRRGEDAIRFYKTQQPPAEDAVGVTLLPEPTRRARWWLVAGLLLVGVLLAALALLLPLGRLSHLLPLAGRGLAEFGLLLTISRLLRAFRPTPADPHRQRNAP